MPFTQNVYHIIWATKHRRPVLQDGQRVRLYKYISAVVIKKGCYVYAVNGVTVHIHLAISLRPAVALSKLIQSIKVSSSLFIKEKNLFPGFTGWQKGYGAFTHSYAGLGRLKNYIEQQEEHHSKESFEDEFIALLDEHHIIEWEARYLFNDD